MNILILDNYDSFTYNLVQMVEQIVGKRIDIIKNDEISLDEIEKYDKIILSPGPGIPSEAGILIEVIKKYAPTKPIFGVCLGQQAIAEAFGGTLINLDNVYHGVGIDAIQIQEHSILRGLPQTIKVGRYHSWAVDRATLPQELIPTSEDKDGIIMSLKHEKYNLHAVQYHPESILTPMGRQILTNFLFDE